MDPKLKTVLAVVAGAVIGVMLFGGVFAAHAVMRTAVFGGGATQSFGMMGQRQGFDDGRGMMGPRDGQYGAPETFGGPGSGCQGGVCPDAGQGMMGPRGGYQRGPQDGTGVCPNGEVCPGVTEDATTES